MTSSRPGVQHGELLLQRRGSSVLCTTMRLPRCSHPCTGAAGPQSNSAVPQRTTRQVQPLSLPWQQGSAAASRSPRTSGRMQLACAGRQPQRGGQTGVDSSRTRMGRHLSSSDWPRLGAASSSAVYSECISFGRHLSACSSNWFCAHAHTSL